MEKAIPANNYRVNLMAEEQEQWDALLNNGNSALRRRTQGRILLEAAAK